MEGRASMTLTVIINPIIKKQRSLVDHFNAYCNIRNSLKIMRNEFIRLNSS